MNLWNKTKELNTAYAIGEKVFKFSIFLLVFSGGSLAGLLARFDPFFKDMTYFRYFLLVVLFSMLFAVIYLLINVAISNSSRRKYYNSLTATNDNVNPLSETFNDLMIRLEDLRLPMNEVHKNKRFKRCHLVGPMTIAVVGGNVSKLNLNYCEEIIALPEEQYFSLPGVIKFLDCTFLECTFVQVTLMTSEGAAKAIQKANPNQKIVGFN